MNCVTKAWQSHEVELRAFIQSNINDTHQAEDLLQDIFIKALSEGNQFCELKNARAWLFRVAKNQIIDYQRTKKVHDEMPEHMAESAPETTPVANLSICLPIALKEMNLEDQEIVQRCDMDGMNQADFAKLKGLSLTATKSRIQRARVRLKEELKKTCHIIFDKDGNVCCFGDEIISNKRNFPKK